MVEFSYNFSPTISKLVETVEILRRDILLVPLSPKHELHYRWEAMLSRLYWSLSLNGNNLSKKEMIKILSSSEKKKLSSDEANVVNYRRALIYINHEWLVTTKEVNVKTVQTLHELACSGKLRVPEATIKQMLVYLQAAKEHPVIQAAIAQIQIVGIAPFSDGNGRTSRLLSLLFLYKHGYDIRGLLMLDDYWRHNMGTFNQTIQNALKNGNITLWIEYFAQACVHQLTKVRQALLSEQFSLNIPFYWHINDRQKEIMAILEQPGSSITNKKVQKAFKISQITASRDLTRLATLGLLFAHGKGRSVYYTHA